MLMATVAFQVATASPATANATDPAAPEMQTTVDADGTIHTPPLSIPPSEYWSDTFRSTYAAMAARMVNIRDYKQPEPTAPKSDWDAFDDRCRQGSAPMLAWQKQNYPVEIRETFLAGVHAAILKPKGGVSPANKNRVLIELHGGSCGGLDGLTEGISGKSRSSWSIIARRRDTPILHRLRMWALSIWRCSKRIGRSKSRFSGRPAAAC